MYIVSSNEMRKIDEYTIKEIGIPAIVLMEQAALKCFKIIKKKIIKQKYKKIIAICGTGNNGGDGLAICRHVYFSGITAEIILVGSINKLSECAQINYDILKKLGLEIKYYPEKIKFSKDYFDDCLVIDALFGTGIKGKFSNEIQELIKNINSSNSYIIAIDSPSGLTDNTENIPIAANLTLTIGSYKTAFFSDCGIKSTGKIKLIELNFPQSAFDNCLNENKIFVNKIEKKLLYKLLPAENSCKTRNSKITIIAGSYKYSGAAQLAIKSALKCGAGLIYALVPKSIANIIKTNIPEAIVFALDELDGVIAATENNKKIINNFLDKSDSVLLGPGLTVSEHAKNICEYIINSAKCRVVIDADGLNNLAENLEILNQNKSAKFILTPHPGEFAKLIKSEVCHIQNNRLEYLKKIRIYDNVVIVLKGKYSIIADNKNRYVNFSGNSLLAAAGTGDVLAGMLASITAKLKDDTLIETVKLSVFLHGSISDFLKFKKKKMTMYAGELIENFDDTLAELLSLNYEYIW